MHPDQPAPLSLPLPHDHFRSNPGHAQDSHPGGSRRRHAGGIERVHRASRQAMRGLGVGAKIAVTAGQVATRQAIRGARWSGALTFRLVNVLRDQLARQSGSGRTRTDHSADSSLYASVPNRLSALAALSEPHYALVRASLPGHAIHQAGSTLLAEGERTPHPRFILSGWAARTRVQDGRLHVLGILLPGDGICLFRPPCAVASSTLVALTTVETADAGQLLETVQQADPDSPLYLSMRRAMYEDEAFLLNQTMRLMMKPATARLAHLLLELRHRLARVGLVRGAEMPFALDRRTLAAALGLSPRDVRSVVRMLERRKIARFGHNRLIIRREDVLRKLGGFTPPAFSEGSRRRLIIDDCAGEATIQPNPSMRAPTHGSVHPDEPRQRRSI